MCSIVCRLLHGHWVVTGKADLFSLPSRGSIESYPFFSGSWLLGMDNQVPGLLGVEIMRQDHSDTKIIMHQDYLAPEEKIYKKVFFK